MDARRGLVGVRGGAVDHLHREVAAARRRKLRGSLLGDALHLGFVRAEDGVDLGGGFGFGGTAGGFG